MPGRQGGEGRRAVLGRIGGAHGVRGWLKVRPFTEAPTTLLRFPRWLLGRDGRWREFSLAEGRSQGSALIVRLEGVADRDAAQALRGCEVAVWRAELPALGEDEYYWSDLEGLAVVTVQGEELGVVDRLFATGANDVMVVRGGRERLIPFVLGEVVLRVDLQGGRVEVDWDPEF